MTKLEIIIGLVDRFSKGMNQVEGRFKRFTVNMKRSWSAISALQGAIAGYAMVRIGKNLTEASMELEAIEAKMKAALPTYGQSQREIAYITEEALRMGLAFKDTAGQYASFAAAATRTGISLEDTRKIFKGFSETAVSLKLPADKMRDIFLALEQIASKGKLQTEELRRQLGQHIPGAVKLAADAMGVTTRQLEKMMKAGEITATDFLPKFADTVRKELGGGFEDASNQLQASISRMRTNLFFLKTDLGELFKEDLKKGVDALSNAFVTLRENIFKIKTVFEVIKGIVIIAHAAGQTIADMAVAFAATMVEIEKITVNYTIGWVKILIAGVKSVGAAIEALKNRDFKALKEVFSPVAEEFTKAKSKINDNIFNIMAVGKTLGERFDGSLNRIATAYANVQMAASKWNDEVKKSPTDILPSAKFKDTPEEPEVGGKAAKRQKKAYEKSLKKSIAAANKFTKALLDTVKKREKFLGGMHYDTRQMEIERTKEGIDQEIALHELKYNRLRQLHKDDALKLHAIDEQATEARKGIMKAYYASLADQAKVGLDNTVGYLHEAASEWKQFAGVYKAVAYAQAVWDTYSAAQSSYKAMAGIPIVGPGLGVAAASAAVIAGIARAQKIRNTEFALGTREFVTSGPQTITVGDNPGGRERVSVQPVSSQNVNGPTSSGQSLVVHLHDNSGGVVETLRRSIRSQDADTFIRELSARAAVITG